MYASGMALTVSRRATCRVRAIWSARWQKNIDWTIVTSNFLLPLPPDSAAADVTIFPTGWRTVPTPLWFLRFFWPHVTAHRIRFDHASSPAKRTTSCNISGKCRVCNRSRWSESSRGNRNAEPPSSEITIFDFRFGSSGSEILSVQNALKKIQYQHRLVPPHGRNKTTDVNRSNRSIFF